MALRIGIVVVVILLALPVAARAVFSAAGDPVVPPTRPAEPSLSQIVAAVKKASLVRATVPLKGVRCSRSTTIDTGQPQGVYYDCFVTYRDAQAARFESPKWCVHAYGAADINVEPFSSCAALPQPQQ